MTEGHSQSHHLAVGKTVSSNKNQRSKNHSTFRVRQIHAAGRV